MPSAMETGQRQDRLRDLHAREGTRERFSELIDPPHGSRVRFLEPRGESPASTCAFAMSVSRCFA
jgi:hypothetical protein